MNYELLFNSPTTIQTEEEFLSPSINKINNNLRTNSIINFRK